MSTQHTIINIERKLPKIIPNTIMSATMGYFWFGIQERVRNSRGKRAISVRATGVLYCMWFYQLFLTLIFITYSTNVLSLCQEKGNLYGN